MNSASPSVTEDLLSTSTTLAFALRHSLEVPIYHELVLENDQGVVGHWAVPVPLRQLAKRPTLLWLLPDPPQTDAQTCVESGSVQLVGGRPDRHVLRLSFGGQLLRGYYRLHDLPIGGGQLWQLTPIGRL